MSGLWEDVEKDKPLCIVMSPTDSRLLDLVVDTVVDTVTARYASLATFSFRQERLAICSVPSENGQTDTSIVSVDSHCHRSQLPCAMGCQATLKSTSLLTTYYLLLTTYYLLLTTYYLLLTTYYSLLASCFLLLITTYFLLLASCRLPLLAASCRFLPLLAASCRLPPAACHHPAAELVTLCVYQPDRQLAELQQESEGSEIHSRSTHRGG